MVDDGVPELPWGKVRAQLTTGDLLFLRSESFVAKAIVAGQKLLGPKVDGLTYVAACCHGRECFDFGRVHFCFASLREHTNPPCTQTMANDR